MGMKDFQLKWAHGMCRGNPNFISGNKLLIPSYFFIKSCDLKGGYLHHHTEPGVRIGCFNTLPELGIIAVGERKKNGPIHVFSYPKMLKLSVLEQTNNEQYSSLHFVGLELLLSLQIKNCYEIDLWKWQSGERVYFLSIPVLDSEIPNVSLSTNPLWWYQVLLQSNLRLILLEIKISDDKYTFDATNYVFLMDEKNKVELSVEDKKSDPKDFHSHVKSSMQTTLKIQSVCWFPENNLLAATSSGIFKVDYGVLEVHKLEDNKPGISSMILSKSGLYIGYKSGYIDIVSIVGCRWHLIETINIEQPIQNLIMSPDYKFLVLVTIKGSIFYRDINQGKCDFKALLRSEFGGEIGVGFVGPLAQICATAKKNGFVHIFRTFDGKMLTSFKLSEGISSMAASPLCCCVVIGTNIGFLYFIDVTDCDRPKIVRCEMPFDTPVNHLKFDNFGRYLFASSHNQMVKIWNGLPSSDFACLGSKKITTQVKDITAFSRTKEEETVLLILTESGSGFDKEAGNVLIRLKLPVDLVTDSKKYQVDIFGTLSGDALSFQKRKLDKPSCKLEAHSTLGAVFYSPDTHKLQSCSVWTDFTNLKLENIMSVKNASFLRISPNQLWMALTDFYGCVNLYSCKELALSASSAKYSASESKCNSFIDFPLFSKNLVCCRENGTIVFFEWKDDSNIFQRVPEWVVNCSLQSYHENKCLRSMEEEERLEIISEDSETVDRNLVSVSEICKELEVCVHVINFKLDELLDDPDLDEKFSQIPIVINEDLLEKLHSENRKKLPLLMAGKDPQDPQLEENREKVKGENAVKVLSSLRLGHVIENFSRESIDREFNLVKSLIPLCETKANIKKSMSSLSFTKVVKMKTKRDRLETIKDLINQIWDLKREFNKDFEHLHSVKSKISDRLNLAYYDAKRLSVSLPSKAERDFWRASIIDTDFGRLLGETESEDTVIQNQMPDEASVKELKTSIQCYAESARHIQEDFDTSVEVLLFKKRYCDLKTYRSEIKIYSLLLFTDAEDKLLYWKEETERDIKHFEGLQNDIDGFLKAFSDIQRSIKDVSVEIQKTERSFSSKIETKCLKLSNVIDMELFRIKQPMFQLDSNSQNPFWRSTPSIYPNDLAFIEKEFQVSCPPNVQKSDWESLCSKKIRVLKIGVILRSLQTQAIIVANTKQLCVDADLMLTTDRNSKQKALRDISILISKLSASFHSLITNQLENIDFPLVGDAKTETELASWAQGPASDHLLWGDISREAFRVQKMQQLLVEIEQHFDRFNELKTEMSSKSADIRNKVLDLVKDLKEKLVECKQNFMETKSVIDEVSESRRMSVFKILKSRFLNENVSQGK